MSTIDTIGRINQTLEREGDAAASSRFMTMRQWLARALAKRKSRIQLGELSDYQLRDIGITKRQARREARRRFWD
jgi:uncharacterized protein YjiS (DUF1127 family)